MSRLLRILGGALSVALILATARADEPPQEAHAALAGHWAGNVEIPGAALAAEVELKFDDGWSGVFHCPPQGLRDAPLGSFSSTDSELKFEIRGIPGQPTFRGARDGEQFVGTFTQNGQSFPFRMKKAATDSAAGRPQEPRPPFPYESTDVEVDRGEIRLAGTLTVPPGDGPHPAALLLTGSGAQNRDEELFGHRPFLVLADHLTRAGIAVLRLDDRGVGGSTGQLALAGLDDLAADAIAAVEFLGARKRIDANRVGVIGHSEGGIVGPLAAVRSPRVGFVVMLAGTGISGRAVLTDQTELLSKAAGLSDEVAAKILAEHGSLLELVAESAQKEKIDSQYRRLVRAQLSAALGGAEPSAEQLDQLAAGSAQVQTPSFRSFLQHDPAETLARLRVPVLALFGERDTQVTPARNLSVVEQALARADNDDVTVTELAGLNHLFQPATSGSMAEYAAIEQTIAPEALRTITDWISERFVKRERSDS